MSTVHALDESNFEDEVLRYPGRVLVSFTKPSAAAHAALAPVLEQIAGKLGGQLKVGQVDVDASPGLAQQYGVVSVPKVVMFEDGKSST